MNGFTFGPVAHDALLIFNGGVCTHTPMKGTSFTAVKSEKKLVQMLCLSTSVHTSIYQYILVCTITSHVFIQIRLEPPCETVSSPLPSCVVERPQRSSWPWFVRTSDHPSVAFLDQTATASSSIHICRVCTAEREARIPALAELVKNSRG